MSIDKFATFLKQRQEELNMTTTEIVRRAGISRQTWYRLSHADVSQVRLKTIDSVARALKVSPMILIDQLISEHQRTSQGH